MRHHFRIRLLWPVENLLTEPIDNIGERLPLLIATGPGAELRRPLGITIIGGMLVSQVLTLYTTPVIYLMLDKLHRRLGGAQQRESWRARMMGGGGPPAFAK